MKLLTANRLDDGTILWWSAGGWVEDAALALALEDVDADALLKEQAALITKFVGVYAIPLDDKGAPVQREAVRETIRANGPSVGPTKAYHAQKFNRSPLFGA